MHTKISSPGYDAFLLKMVAIIGMAMQHTVLVLGELIPVGLHFPLQLAGGFTFPIMAFLLVEGYRHTSDIKRYMTRLFVWGLISQVPYSLAFRGEIFTPFLNIMFTLCMGLFVLVMYDYMENRKLFAALFVFICLVSFFFDWGPIAPIVIFLFYVIKVERIRRIVPPVLAGGYGIAFAFIVGIIVAFAAELGLEFGHLFDRFLPDVDALDTESFNLVAAMAGILFPVGSVLTGLLLRRYNGRRGRSLKYLFYGFYPLHLLILAIVAYLAGVWDFEFLAF